MRSLGVSNETTVVAYSDAQLPARLQGRDDVRLMFSTRLWWVLTYYGHPRTKVLDGGFLRWSKEGRPTSTDDARPARGTFVPIVRDDVICDVDDLISRHRDPTVQVVSVLARPVYDGAANPFNNKRAGHIPGSILLNPAAFVDDTASFKPAAELEQVLAEAGIAKDREVVVHCQGGIATTVAVFVLSLLGRAKVRAYDGSMWEWANRDDTPLELSAE